MQDEQALLFERCDHFARFILESYQAGRYTRQQAVDRFKKQPLAWQEKRSERFFKRLAEIARTGRYDKRHVNG